MNTNYDVMIVGAGPIGLTFASTLKVLNKELKICILDKREQPTRHHGLNIRGDSIVKIQEVLDQALNNQDPSIDVKSGKELKNIFLGWKNSFIKTSEIELNLVKQAQKMGITVLKGQKYHVSSENIEQLLDSVCNPKFNSDQQNLHSIFRNAQVVVGADGSHSDVRRGIMGEKVLDPQTNQSAIQEKLIDKETLQYLIELKYQTEGKAIPRSSIEASLEFSKCGHVDIESMNSKNLQANKPVTLHIFVDKETFESFRQIDKGGKLKGVFGNSWTLKEIGDQAKGNEKIKKVYQIFKRHLKGIQARGGKCYNEQISTLDLTIFRSEESVKQYQGKKVLLVGDANSAMVLERGFNKGVKEAALAAEAVNDYFKDKNKYLSDSIPTPFLIYQEKTRQIFENEKWWAQFKNSWIRAVQLIIKFLSSKIVSLFNWPRQIGSAT